MKKILLILIITSSLLPIFQAEAVKCIGQTDDNAPCIDLPNPLGPNTTLQSLINNVVDWATGLLIAISVLFIIYAAYLFMFAGGDPKNVSKAKNIILYTVVAIVIALMSRAILSAVEQILKSS